MFRSWGFHEHVPAWRGAPAEHFSAFGRRRAIRDCSCAMAHLIRRPDSGLRWLARIGDKNMMNKFPSRLLSAVSSAILAISLVTFVPTASAEILVKSGEKIGFLGDSITAAGWGNPAGYVHLVVAGLAANGVNVVPVPAGVGGHKSNDMLARLERDVLSKKPQWMTLSCGVNDVWHGVKGVPLDDAQAAATVYEKRNDIEPEKGTYKKNITEIVEKAQAAGAKVMILTATVIREDLNTPENHKLAAYNDFLRQVAKEKHLLLADLNEDFQKRITAENKPGQKVLTVDGVHMNTEGNKLMATGILKAFGLNESEIKKAQESWAPLEAAAEEAAKKAAEAKAKAEAAKAAAAAAPAPAVK
jgi:lysophospholipase L1-like esterase